ncbi:MAG: hypothetical protein RLZZ175_2713 [Bacteroidota bacterium]|jgi:hypothetical protein
MKALFVYSDPGGARMLLSKLWLQKELFEEYCIISDRVYQFTDEYGFEIQKYNTGDEIIKLNDFNPEVIYTATSYTSEIELKFIESGQNKNIKTISLIDHWTNFRNRFFMKSKGIEIFPYFIEVIDNKSYDFAINEGIDQDKLKVTCHYYHEFLKKWLPNISKDEFSLENNLLSSKKWIVYAPDPLTNVGGVEEWGVDEVIGLDFVLNSIKKSFNAEIQLYIKPHPNQNLEIFDKLHHNIVILGKDVPTNLLIKHSNLVISFFSNILFEAQLLGTKVVSLQLGKILCKLPTSVSLLSVTKEEELTKLLNEL